MNRNFQADYDRITRIAHHMADSLLASTGSGSVPMESLIILDCAQRIIRAESLMCGQEVR